MTDEILHDQHHDGIDRRGFLEVMAWVGTGVIWTLSGGVLGSRVLGQDASAAAADADFTVAQISDSYIDFEKEPNTNVVAMLQEAIAKLNKLTTPPDFVFHTGDLSHLSKPDEFDTHEQAHKAV